MNTMNASTTNSTAVPAAEMALKKGQDSRQTLDRTLTEIRSGRRLEKIVSSIEGFLVSQVTRLDAALEECHRAVENDKIVQRILADFELDKKTWEADRQAEIERLSAAGEELIRGWEQLEDERRKWADQRK